MEKLEHPLWIVDVINAVLGPPVKAALEAAGFHIKAEHGIVIPNYLVMVMLIVAGLTVVSLIVRSRLSVENPGPLQILFEDGLTALINLLEEWIGPTGRNYLPLIATFGIFILCGNYLGLIPGLMAPTSNINVTLGCAITTWVYTTSMASKSRASLAISSISGRRPARHGSSEFFISRSS